MLYGGFALWQAQDFAALKIFNLTQRRRDRRDIFSFPFILRGK